MSAGFKPSKPLNIPYISPRNFLIFMIVCLIVFTFYAFVFESEDSAKEYDVKPLASKDSNYPIKLKLKSLLKCHDERLVMETLQHGEYWVLRNLIRGRRSIEMGCAESITYTTNGDYTYMGNLATLVMRWLGPVSVALFAPGYDFIGTMNSIQYARNCLPESKYIRDFVTFHIYFPIDHMYEDSLPRSEDEALLWPYDCTELEAPYQNIERPEMYRVSMNLTYPINAGRNIARTAVNTYFILAADIELYPSLKFIEQFLYMAAGNVSLVLSDDEGMRVFPLPVFELDEVATVPESKEELLLMLDIRFAITYQENICKSCHLVPELDKWVKANPANSLEVLTIAKRYDDFAHWEPVYVSDNKEPAFDERVTLEDQCNKRIQNYAMCLKDYEYHVLHPAFLVHSPGIKEIGTDLELLNDVETISGLVEDKILPEYNQLYGENKKCRV